jgi:hypothetical protein
MSFGSGGFGGFGQSSNQPPSGGFGGFGSTSNTTSGMSFYISCGPRNGRVVRVTNTLASLWGKPQWSLSIWQQYWRVAFWWSFWRL